MSDQIEWTGGNFQAVRDFCRRDSDGFSAVLYRDGGQLYLEAEDGTTHINVGDHIVRTGPDTFTVARAT